MEPRRLARESGDLRPRDFAQALASDLIRRFAPAPRHRFDGGAAVTGLHAQPAPSNADPRTQLDRPHDLRAHGAGAGSLALDKFDGRILVSGGADGTIKIWDLEDCPNPNQTHTFRPKATIARYIAPDAPLISTTTARDGNIMVARGMEAGGAAGAAGGAVDRPRGHSHGITHVGFYPFDPDAFLSSSYDKTLKLWATSRAALSAAFDLNASIYSHSTSPVGQHLTVACATQHASVRLVDLRSGSAVQALVAHGGPVLCTAWSPRHEHLLASGHADGRARIWDIRRAGGVVAQLDQEDSLGVVHRHRHELASRSASPGPARPRFRSSAIAHDEAVNGLLWTDDGRYIVSAGLDRRIRVWDADRGANTLVGFGPIVQNQHVRTASFVVCPTGLLAGGLGRGRGGYAGGGVGGGGRGRGDGGSGGSQVLIWPNDYEILMLDLHGGTVLARLKSPGAVNPLRRGAGGGGGGGAGEMANRKRITSIVWRGAGGGTGQVGPLMGGGGSAGAIYSAHLDGQIRAWMPALAGSDDAGREGGDDDDDDDKLNEDSEVRRRKRKAVDDAYRSLMGKKITFT